MSTSTEEIFISLKRTRRMRVRDGKNRTGLVDEDLIERPDVGLWRLKYLLLFCRHRILEW
jgi:hypothetical protein